MALPTLEHERRLGGPVCGIDEVGRGPWAGPVVAAAVMLDFARVPDGLDDSKRLPAVRRRELDIAIRACAHVSIAMASVEEVDRLNVLGASMLAMERAFAGLPHPPEAGRGASAWIAFADGARVVPVP